MRPVMNQVDLKMSRVWLVPGDPLHRYVPEQAVPGLGSSPGQSRLILADPGQDPLYGGHTGLVQLFQQLGSDTQFPVSRQVLGQPGQIRGQTVGADVVRALGNDTQSIIHFWPISAAPLPATE